jgi:hypothetical protein
MWSARLDTYSALINGDSKIPPLADAADVPIATPLTVRAQRVMLVTIRTRRAVLIANGNAKMPAKMLIRVVLSGKTASTRKRSTRSTIHVARD